MKFKKVGAGLILLFLTVFCFEPCFAQSKIDKLEKTLKEAQKSDKTEEVRKTYLEIGNYYLEANEFKKAIKNYKRSLDVSEDDKNQSGIVAAKNKIGSVYVKKAEYDEALSNFESALKVAKANNLSQLVSETNANINGVKEKMSLQKTVDDKYDDIKSMKKEDVVKLVEEEKIKQKEEENRKEAVINQKVEFLEKIQGLSAENQLIAIKLEFKQRELERNKLEITVLNKIKELKNAEIAQKDLESQKHRAIIGFSVALILILLFLAFIIFRGYLQKKKANSQLISQNKVIEEKNREILDSITYAKRIQTAILPQPKLVKEYFNDSFILYKPKDIVAGDFYWFEVIGDLIFFAAADCTGHGVPGAMVSVVCHNALNRSVKEFNLKNPAEILDKTRELVIAEFEKSDEDVKDGMDISLAVIALSSVRSGKKGAGAENPQAQLFWAGAHNPLWILRKNELIIFKADKQPIGEFAHSKPFSKHEIPLYKGDEIYIFTDGFQDQFGGPAGKKFKPAKMKELLLGLNQNTMEERRTAIDAKFENWKGNLEQVDDVCVIGVRI